MEVGMPSLRLRIKGRLYVGFMALVAVGLVMAGVAVLNLRSVQDQVGKLSALSDSTARTLEVSTHLQAIQRANLSYVHDGSETAMKEAAERETAATELLRTGARGTQSEERRRLYNDLIADIARMRSLRDKLGDAVNEVRTGKATLLPSGEELTTKMAKLVDAARSAVDEDTASLVTDLESRILLVRIANWRFLALRDAKGPATFRASVDRAAQRLSALEKSPQATDLKATLASVKTALGIYQSAFDTTSSAMLQADEIYQKDLAPLIVESIAKLKTAEATLKQDYKASRSQAETVIEGTTTIQEIAAGIAILFGSIVAFLIARSIVVPLGAMTRAMGQLAGGNLEVEIPGRGRADEIGDMAKAIGVFKDNMIETERLRAEQSQIEARQAESRKADMVRLADQFEQAIGEIVDTVSSASTELEASAGTLTATATRAQDLSTEVQSASQEASANVQAVASATEELSSSVTEIARQVQESARIASDAVSQASRTNNRVSELSKAAARIGDVVELISTIAGQTNLLALNATIEAARAGEAGRGFAVVASEVKALAEQTAKATGEIAQQVSGIQAATEESVGSIREISDTIARLSEISSTVAAAVEEQGAATQEISRNVQQAAQGTQRVSANIGDVQRGASDTGSASSQVLSAARSLSADSNRLKAEVAKFLSTVQAA
jgi:methyl-accepting chemotaxis protein